MVCIISLDKFIGSDGQPRLLPNRLLFCINELETYSAPCITIALSLALLLMPFPNHLIGSDFPCFPLYISPVA
jgi:hypothetical protein